MPEYKKMYALLCGAMSEAVDMLARTPENLPAIEHMLLALEQAEQMYIQSADD